MDKKFDIIVIGGGHAGIEAALAASRLSKKVALFTIFLDNIGMMSCNPSIGGPGKSHLVSEIDVLGGEIGKHTDKYNLQMKNLNKTKGLAARVTRAQADKFEYRKNIKSVIENEKNITPIQEIIDEIIIENGKVVGVKSSLDIKYFSKSVILCTGTFLKGEIVIGDVRYSAGRQGEVAANNLSDSLTKNGIKLGRFQTATPPRIDKNSIDFSKLKKLEGEDKPNYFSIFTNKESNRNIPTWLTYTNEKTLEKVKEMLKYSPIVTGGIDSKGPRHCPSIDRKVINFPEKLEHQVFLELESGESSEIYVNGMTTSMPPFAQEEIMKTLPGLENVKIMRYGYGIEYDYAYPYQLFSNLESKIIENLFFAGQINGTSGYEEAAAQGFLAGVNSCLKNDGKEPVIIRRDEGYIGVLIDDLINKELLEPYRVLPSRSEYRLTLRQDNTFIRLLEKSEKIGILKKEKIKYLKNLKEAIENEMERLEKEIVYPTEENNLVLEGMNEKKLKKSISCAELLKRNSFNYEKLKYFTNLREYPRLVIEQVEINIKYQDFIKRERDNIEKYKQLDDIKIPKDFNYYEIKGISNIAKESLYKIKPYSIGQASRITGITSSDISILIGILREQ